MEDGEEMGIRWTSILLAIVQVLENKLDDLCAASVSNKIYGVISLDLLK